MERSKFSLSFFSLQQLHVSFNSSMQILGIYSWSRNMVWRSLNQVLSLIMDLHGRWRRGEETERFTSRLALCVCVLLDLGGLIWLEFFLLTFFIKSCCLLWWTGIRRRNQAGVVTHICLHVLRTLSHSLSLSLWHTHTLTHFLCACVWYLNMLCSFSFVEIMAPVFSREAWRCVWHMIQVFYVQRLWY
jgi:hypothetical protein